MECFDVPVAQLDRALASDAKGRGFDSCQVRHDEKLPVFTGSFFILGQEPNRGSFWLIGSARRQPPIRCGHSVCNICFASLPLALKLTNLHLSLKTSPPEIFFASSLPGTP